MASAHIYQLPVTESPTPESTHVYIDEQGVHDFDFRHRRSGTPGSSKLNKFGRRSVQSASSMAEVQRSTSTGSDGSLRKRFSALLAGNDSVTNLSNKKHKSTASLNSMNESQEDPLPDTKKDLEIRLNYHLSELDLLKRTIRAANDVIRQHHERYQLLEMRSTPDMKHSMKRQEQLVQQARINRNSYSSFVCYHRKQLERIKQKRIEIEEATGLEPTLPEVYKNLWTDDDWAAMFRP